jgi:PTS system mannose-specific IIC component
VFTFDLHTLAVVFGIAVAGGIIGLDRTAAGQFMISQPIIAAPITGWLLGDSLTGMIIGSVLELLWVLDMPVGTFVPADATLGAVSATAIAVLAAGTKPPLDLVGFSIVATTVTIPITMVLDRFARARNSRLGEAASGLSGEHAGSSLTRIHLSGLFVFFFKSFVLYLVFIPAGLAAAGLFNEAPKPLHTAMILFVKVLPLLGAAVVFSKLSRSVANRSFFLGFGAAAVLSLALQVNPLIIILLIGAAVFLKSMRREGPL